ncbi:CRISPR-associated exonuclease Cas4 [Halopenitus persicus]|uniref:CRISPR-associated exonuclease Cas4 n=1 Tax=Halopenitus persicus TaxID=1048396 RepID=A0A1H3I6W3_9EURY|nr:CRISPR-associated exonuclease Cas4 [Halopenitus persicus]
MGPTVYTGTRRRRPVPDTDPPATTVADAAAAVPTSDATQSSDAVDPTSTEATQSSADRSTRIPSGSVAFGDLTRAAYCPRQLYYARREPDRSIPDAQRSRIDLAFRYPELVTADDAALSDRPIDPSPTVYRERLRTLRDGGCRERFGVPWRSLANPDRTRAFLVGRSCHGIAHKVLSGDEAVVTQSGDHEVGSSVDDAGDADAGDPPIPCLVSPGTPPERGVWEPQTVRAVAIAKALAWEREREIPRVLVEYPAVGVVREVSLTVRTTAAYRRALRTARGIDGPPPRVSDDRCPPCEYRDRCGTETRSLRSRLGL